MKWFKHDADARNSLKLRKVRRKYGADGYAIYWFCLEAIAYEVDKDNLSFDLKEDAETIAFELSIQEKRVEEIMLYLVDTGLFESSQGVITCLKLAERLDKSMTNSPKMRQWLDNKNVMTSTDTVNSCAELDKNRSDKTRPDKTKEDHTEEIINPKEILFNKFWKAYDYCSAEKKCKAKFIKLNNATIEKIMSVVDDYVKSTPDKTFRKKPWNWLQAESWNDEIQLPLTNQNQQPASLGDAGGDWHLPENRRIL